MLKYRRASLMTAQGTTFRTGDQALVREINLSLIMNCLRTRALSSRAELAEITGLNKSTVSSLITELIERHFVREVGYTSTGIGRPSVQLELNPKAGYIVTGEIGVDFVSVVCANFSADILWQHQENTEISTGQQATIDHTLVLLRRAIAMGRKECDGCGGLLGLSVGVPGLVDHTTGMLLFVPNLQWENVPLGHMLHDAFSDALIFVDNEAKLAALGEYFFGAAQGYNEVLYISAGVGLGGAVVRNSYLVKGKTGFAGEFGHMTMNPAGERCNCGNQGCWETQVSQLTLFRYIRQAVAGGNYSLLCSLTENDLNRLTVPMVVTAAEADDAVALEALETIGHDLGIGIASLVNALNPDLVLLGGILSLAGKFLLPIVELELEQRALRWNAEATQVALAQHGFDACVMGGVAMVYQAILAQPGTLAH